MNPPSLHFTATESGAYAFDTGVLQGLLRQNDKSIGLFPVRHKASGTDITGGEGLFNHYRVFTHGKRYGYGARRWPSTASLQTDGSIEVSWQATSERPFSLHGHYQWVNPYTIDLRTTVRAEAKLEAFEVFLASYYQPPFIDSQVWASRDPRGGNQQGFVSADEELGTWLAFPRDDQSASVIRDGRWDLEPHPLLWTMMPSYALPLAIRRDPASGISVIVMAETTTCFGVFTPYGTERHYSNYFSLFGQDIEAGQEASACTRLAVMDKPSTEEILDLMETFQAL